MTSATTGGSRIGGRRMAGAATAFMIVLLIWAARSSAAESIDRAVKIDSGWKFLRIDGPEAVAGDSNASPQLDDASWETVSLPHTPRIEPLDANHMWQGVCWYRLHLKNEPEWAGRSVAVKFGGAMSVADVWINGKHATTHLGGYLPFSVDLTGQLVPGDNVIAVRLDNRDNKEVPPGKPYKGLDFDWYGGLYRDVSLRVTDPLHVSDAVAANRPAGGGVFVTYPQVSANSAVVDVQLDVENRSAEGQSAAARFQLIGSDGAAVAGAPSDTAKIPANGNHVFRQQLRVEHPRLWTPQHPALYSLKTEVLKDGMVVDSVTTPIGIRRIAFSASGGFEINGQRMYLRGTDRHQEYPFVGYALSDDAQYRDAVKIKEAGFDFVRLCHYPQSPAFLDACDELGLVVMEPIPGWQFMGDNVFAQNSYAAERDMIRRDRNHPSLIMWETSLNETAMKKPFMADLQRIAHEEFPGDQCFTAGWKDAFDVYIESRQAGGCHKFKDGDKACLVSEYGDWEYWSRDAGLNQAEFKNLTGKERSSRQSRGDGEERLLRQMLNFQQAANDNRTTPAVADAIWVMFDYSRGYAPDLETSGVMDSMRLAKPAYYFFQSQRDAGETSKQWHGGPMVYIASNWTNASVLPIRVVSNCDEVALSLNGKVIARQKPDRDAESTKLPHPPFTFAVPEFEPGTLEATGYIGGQAKAHYRVKTPGAGVKLRLWADVSARPLRGDDADAVFVYAAVVDADGTIVPTAAPQVTFATSSPGSVVGDNPATAEAGIAGVLVRSAEMGRITVRASAPGLDGGEVPIDATGAAR